MTLPLPSIPDLLHPPYMAVLRRSGPVTVPPGEQWTAVAWDLVDSDAWDGFDPSRPGGWRAPCIGGYQAAASGFTVASTESFAFEAALLRDGELAPGSGFARLLDGGSRDEFDEPGQEDRPVVRHAVTHTALVWLESGQRVGLALRHSLPVPLAVESEGGGLGWLVQQVA